MDPAWSRGTAVLLLLVPGGLSDPVEGEACVCPDLDGSRLGLPHGLLHRLHQVLSVVDQHLSRLLGEGSWNCERLELFFSKSYNWKMTLSSPALTPPRWCWCDPTWWPWPWTGSWAECWWWECAHTPETRSENNIRLKHSLYVLDLRYRKYTLDKSPVPCRTHSNNIHSQMRAI